MKTQDGSKFTRIKVIIKVLFLIFCVFFFSRWLFLNWVIIKSALSNTNWVLLFVSFLLLSIAFLLLPSGMFVFMRSMQANFSYLQSSQAYYGSQMAKYLPGGIWAYPSRLIIMKEKGFSLSDSTLATSFETFALVVSSLIISMITLGATFYSFVNFEIQIIIILICSSLVIALLTLPELISKVTKKKYKIPGTLKSIKSIPVLKRARILLVSVFVYSLMWGFAGLSFYVLSRAVSETFSIDCIPYVIGVFTLAWLVGFISFLIPGGIGVRESIIIGMLITIVPKPYPFMIAVLARILWSINELAFFAFSVFIDKWYLQSTQIPEEATS